MLLEVDMMILVLIEVALPFGVWRMSVCLSFSFGMGRG